MENMKEFRAALAKALRKVLGENYRVEEEEIVKLNHTVEMAVVVKSKDEPVAPVIYMEALYARYKENESLSEIVQECMKIIDGSEKNELSSVALDILTDWGKAKEHLRMKLVNTQKNKQMLQDLPSIPFLNLSIVFYICLGENSEGSANAKVTNKMLEGFGVDVKELYEQALLNMKGEMSMLTLMNPDPDEKMCGLFVLSNTRRLEGAAEILLDETKEKLVEKFRGSNLFILPSSIHELILIPDTEGFDAETLLLMVQEVNETEVDEKDFLADAVYLFNGNTKEISIAARRDSNE